MNKIFRNTMIVSCLLFLFAGIMQLLANDNYSVVQQGITVSGVVTEATGDPLPGVNVVVKGTLTGQVTDVNGRYSINVPDGNAVLQFSFIGYVTAEFTVGNQRMINVELRDDASQIEEVVVVGYGTQKKANLTGAVDVISEKTLANRAAPSVAQLIQGAAPNVTISTTRDGGEPGATRNWQIRGMGSIAGDDVPLILVDGIESPIDAIDPESIESISILKDASASSIYGSRAPFGVVLITTKKGKNQPARVSYSNNFSFHKPFIAHFIDAYTWANAYNQISAEGQGAGALVYTTEPTSTDPIGQVPRIQAYMAGTYPYEYSLDQRFASVWRPRWEGNANYDWPSIYMNRRDPMQKHNINVEGGNERMNFYVSAGLLDQPGLQTWGNDSYKRYNVLANISAKAADWLKFNIGMRYSKDETNRPDEWNNTDRYNIQTAIYTFGPMLPWHSAEVDAAGNVIGTKGDVINPIVAGLQKNGREVIQGNNMAINLGTEIEPVKGWKTNISYNYQYGVNTNLRNPKPVNVKVGHWADAPVTNVSALDYGTREQFSTDNRIVINATTSYAKMFGKHFFKILAGYEQELYRYRRLTGFKTGLIHEDIVSITSATGEINLTDAISHWATRGYFGRIEYNFNEKYLLEFSGRYSGSSKFPKDSRWGLFPAGAVGYVISKEDFWAPIQQYVNFLKLRVSYGSLGNCNVDNYLYLPTLNIQTREYYLVNGIRPTRVNGFPSLVSANLTWEKVRTLNLGVDAAFLNNRLTATFEWYNRKTLDMIGPAESLPSVLGAGVPSTNNAELETKGFELTLKWHDQISRDLSYNVGFSLGDSRTKVTKYNNPTGILSNWYSGKMSGEFWGFDVEKIMQTQEEVDQLNGSNRTFNQQYIFGGTWNVGDFKYVDHTGDGVVDAGLETTLKDHGDLRIIGNSTPRFNYGITAGANWKGFDFSMFWQGLGKRDFMPNRNNVFYYGWCGGGSTGSESGLFKDSPSLNYWRPENTQFSALGPNTDALFARWYTNSGDIARNVPTNASTRGISRFVLNARYLRLKNIQLGYTLPTELSRKVWVQRARIYVSGENVLTFSPLPKSMEPETAVSGDSNFGGSVRGTTYPITKSISFGLNLTF